MSETEVTESTKYAQRRGSNFSALFSRKLTAEKDYKHLTPCISDYEILKRSGGVDEISFMFLAKHLITGKRVSLKLTDLKLSQDYEFIEQLIVRQCDCIALHANL